MMMVRLHTVCLLMVVSWISPFRVSVINSSPAQFIQDHTRSLWLVYCVVLIFGTCTCNKSCPVSFSTSFQSCGTESCDVISVCRNIRDVIHACVQNSTLTALFPLVTRQGVLTWSQVSAFSTRWLHWYTLSVGCVLTKVEPALSGESLLCCSLGHVYDVQNNPQG